MAAHSHTIRNQYTLLVREMPPKAPRRPRIVLLTHPRGEMHKKKGKGTPSAARNQKNRSNYKAVDATPRLRKNFQNARARSSVVERSIAARMVGRSIRPGHCFWSRVAYCRECRWLSLSMSFFLPFFPLGVPPLAPGPFFCLCTVDSWRASSCGSGIYILSADTTAVLGYLCVPRGSKVHPLLGAASIRHHELVDS